MHDQLIAYENGELDAKETLDLFSRLMKSGVVWQLQGSYGRAAQAMILCGLITPDGVLTDFGQEVSDSEED